jgi:serine protease Do
VKNAKVAEADANVEAHGRLGVAVRELTRQEQKEAGVAGGLVVENATGAAASAGIQAGDVILSLNDTPVKSVKQLQGLLAKAGKRVALLVQREDAKLYVPVELG